MTLNASPPYPLIQGYSLYDTLGTGSSATVYLATQDNLQRPVALKVLDPLLLRNQTLKKRFLREARTTAAVSNHSGVVTIYDVNQCSEHCYIAMEYISGCNLRQRLDGAAPLPDPVAVIRHLAHTLSHVHQHGLLHRDIKPANILFDNQQNPVLSDFGIAKSDAVQTELTQFGTILGTARYMSPEQACADSVIDQRSDLYSLGVVLYEILTRSPPFESHDPMVLMLQHRNDPPPPLPSSCQAFQPLINRLLAKRPEERYASASALLSDLPQQSLSTGHTQSLQPTGNTQEYATQDDSASRTHRAATLIVAACTLVVLSAAVIFMSLNPAEPASHDVQACATLTPHQRAKRDRLLETARLHEAVGRLTQPPGANALDTYHLALAIDHCHHETVGHIDRINRDMMPDAS